MMQIAVVGATILLGLTAYFFAGDAESPETPSSPDVVAYDVAVATVNASSTDASSTGSSDDVSSSTASSSTASSSAELALASGERELLPDLVPLPPRDLYLKDSTEGLLLTFSTTYYNQGDGPLELRADPTTHNTPGDIPRTVSQQIYHEDGSVSEQEAGVFLWHHEHIHYHFIDFVLYALTRMDDDESKTAEGQTIEQKSTFCVRDISTVDLELEHRTKDAAFQICGRERQGVSVGWGDTYFHTYPDQNLNVSDLESGTYELSFLVNPEDRFEEITKENNRSAARFYLDVDEKTLELLEEYPSDTPAVEHIYEE